MSYADGLLSTGERIIHRNKQHPFIFIWGARWTILAVVLATLLLWISSNMDDGGFSGTAQVRPAAGSSWSCTSAASRSSPGPPCATSTRSTS